MLSLLRNLTEIGILKNIHDDESAAALLSQKKKKKKKKNKGTVSSQGNANNCEEDPTIFGSNVLPTFIAFPNEDSDEDTASVEERDKEPSNHNKKKRKVKMSSNKKTIWRKEGIEKLPAALSLKEI